nr:DUF92 domain-containing protein [Candidatus Sigynarchaeota archaeon]
MSLFWNQFGFMSFLYLLGIGLGCVINVLVMSWALKHEHLTRGGAITALAMGISFWVVSPFYFILLLLFFMTSSMLSKYKKARKVPVQDKFSKGGRRDVRQVLANGLVAWVFVVACLVAGIVGFPLSLPIELAMAFSATGAIAATNADTWGT